MHRYIFIADFVERAVVIKLPSSCSSVSGKTEQCGVFLIHAANIEIYPLDKTDNL